MYAPWSSDRGEVAFEVQGSCLIFASRDSEGCVVGLAARVDRGLKSNGVHGDTVTDCAEVFDV